MDVKHVKMFREQAGDRHYTVVCDNMLLYHANVPFNYILWDDANEVFYAIKLSDDQYNYNEYPYAVVTTTYDMIQAMRMDRNEAELRKFVTATGVTTPDINTMLNEFKTKTEFNPVKKY